MAVVYTKKDQGNSVTSGTGAPTHTAVAGDRYTDTATGNTYQYTTSWQIVSYGASVNIYNSNGALTGARTVDLNGVAISFTDSIGTSSVNFAIDDGAGDYSSLYQIMGGFTMTAGSGSFSKSFYVDNIGVGVYASGTAGRYNLPNVQPTLNQIPYASSTSQLGFTSVKTINGNSILGSGNIVAGLSYFTEAQATASPNNLVNVDSLTAVASTTDADFAILAKGNGAILASIPNSIAIVPNVGGNKRGQYALDLQHYGQINAGTEVASGNYAAIVCGSRNTASASNDTVLNGFRNTSSGGSATILNGQLNSASGGYSFVGAGQSNNATSTYATVINGYANNATSSYTFTGGFGSIASGTRAFSYGEYCYATGAYSLAIGSNNQAASDSSVALGVYANSFNVIGRFVFGTSGSNYTTGTSQASKLVLTNLSTSATPIELAVQNTISDARYNLTLQDNQAMRVKGSIIGKQSGTLNVGAWDFDYVIVRGVGVGTTTIVVANVNVVTNIPAWGTPTITADTARGYASIKVIGATTTNIRWSATVESVEIIYA